MNSPGGLRKNQDNSLDNGSKSGLIASFLIRAVNRYQRSVSPLLPKSCRFIPTCSQYAIIVLKRFSIVKALGLIICRLLRCNPLCRGGLDEPPER